jgi:antitoxin ParD1/3/4
MTTVTMNISLTEDLKSFVDSRIKARGYSSASEYMRELVRRDEEKAKEDRFKQLIQDGIESGPGGTWEDVKAKMQERVTTHRSQAVKQTPARRKAA